jgi:hypothetical protein
MEVRAGGTAAVRKVPQRFPLHAVEDVHDPEVVGSVGGEAAHPHASHVLGHLRRGAGVGLVDVRGAELDPGA